MFKLWLTRLWFYPTVASGCLLAGLFTATQSAYAQPDAINLEIVPKTFPSSVDSYSASSDIDLNKPNDPLNSPYPVPWNWLIETQAQFSQQEIRGLQYYRSPSLVSPDGKYAAYTRIQLVATPELYNSRVTSVMFVENLQTGTLQVVRADSPLGKELRKLELTGEIPGIISILIPASWSSDSDRLLSRQLEGFFSTSDVSDYGVIWERQTNQTKTLIPVEEAHQTSILLGWNHDSVGDVLFRTGMLGEEDWPIASVSPKGKIARANNLESITYGQLVTHSWTGNQTLQ